MERLIKSMFYMDWNCENDFNIVDLFYDACEKYPAHIAIIEEKNQVSYSELREQVNDTTLYFIRKGIKKGDRVIIFVPMSIDLYRIVLALFTIGATVVFLDEWVSKKRMEMCCKVAQCRAFIGNTKAKILIFFSPELRKIPIRLGINYSSGLKGDLSHTSVKYYDTALITFTTGTTGKPKAAKRTHGFLHEQFKVLAEKIKPQPADVSLPVLPIVLLINLGAGATSLITDFKARKPEQTDVKKIINQILFYKVDTIVASPFFIKQLANTVIKNKNELPGLQRIFTGGAPVFPSEGKIYKQAFPGAEIEIVYGSTEAEPISAIKAEELITTNALSKGLAVGKPDRNIDVKIITLQKGIITCENEDDFNKIILPVNETGEIIVSGPHVLDAYFNNEEALKLNKIFVGRKCWHRTGDSGFLTNDGRLFLTGRCNSLIFLNNKIIAPFIYEGLFQNIAGVEAGTVLERDNVVIAIIEAHKHANKKVISEYLQKHGDVIIPINKIIFIKKMPRDPRHHSKIDYEKLHSII